MADLDEALTETVEIGPMDTDTGKVCIYCKRCKEEKTFGPNDGELSDCWSVYHHKLHKKS